MRIKCIICDVFARPAYAAAARSEHIVDLELLPMLAHTEPDKLRADLQSRIDRVDTALYDILVLGYGLCGNATSGLTAALPMVMPRAHDCCTLFMGSRERFQAVFGKNLSMRWCTCGYYERCIRYGYQDDYETYRTNPEYIKLLEDYGEENAEYVWQTLHPTIETNEAVYIETEGLEYNYARETYTADVVRGGKELILEPGDLRWFNRLINGPWDDTDFLTIEPGSHIEPVYDMQEVVRASGA